MPPLTDIVKNLLIVNVLAFLATLALEGQGIFLNYYGGLHSIGSEGFYGYQLVTHMFLHGGFGHIFFNMFGVWIFGASIERVWGAQKFLMYYLLCGLGAAALHLVMGYVTGSPSIAVGASGAVFGLLLAYGMMYPDRMIYVNFIIPMKAKYFVLLYGAAELFMASQNNPSDNVAHFAHLGGMIMGFLLIKLWISRSGVWR